MRRTAALFLSLLCFGSCSSGSATVKSEVSAPTALAAVSNAPRLVSGEARGGGPDPVIAILAGELQRARNELASAQDGEPYFIGYQLTDRHRVGIHASFGALSSSLAQQTRALDVDLRMGDYALDSTHPLRGGAPRGQRAQMLGPSPAVPLDRGEDALRAALWLETNDSYQRAVERLSQVKAERKVRVEEEDRSADFSREPPLDHIEAIQKLELDVPAWEQRLRRLSAQFRAYDSIHSSSVSLGAEAVTRWLVTSEGSRVQISSQQLRVQVEASTTADDGMRLSLQHAFSASSPTSLDEAAIASALRTLAENLVALREAPVAEPYAGPAILEGEAAAVFFHEVFGHRVEGHRQKDESDGQTFAKKVGKPVMADFIDVYDDPRVATLNGIELMGHYRVDDEGVAARRADLVRDGVFKTFLMSRAPTRGFDRSNGHGRRHEGYRVVARQANLVVEASRSEPMSDLRARLLRAIADAKKPYGLIVRQVSGGYTSTDRSHPQAFKVEPLLVYRVYPDGREQLVRGLDLEGTPLTALSKIVAAGDDYAVFNGSCGAESGWVPVSAASPSLFVQQLEFARQDKSNDRPPLLPRPPLSTGETPGGGTP